MKRLVAVIHAGPGVGKSRLLDTAPGPRLILDVEGGTDWTLSPKWKDANGKDWDPATPPPTGLTPDQSVVVQVLNYDTLRQVIRWLSSGQHEFESVCLDSITEIQKRCKDAIGGIDTFSERQWGELLNKMEYDVRTLRDLKVHPVKPVHVFISAITVMKDGKYKADVQGALVRSLPTFPDVVGYLYPQTGEDGMERRMLIVPTDTIEAKDRTDRLTEKYGATFVTSVGRNNICDLGCMVKIVNGEEIV